MRLCRFQRPDKSTGWGLLTASGIQDISIADPTLPINTVDVITDWDKYESRIEYLSKRLGVTDDSFRLLQPLSTVGKVLCIGLNYRDHAEETGAAIPDEPIVFCKMPTAVIGDGEPIVLPNVCERVDYEAELVIVIGTKVKDISEDQASRAIFGYAVGHDVSARDWQTGKPGKQWFLGKSFDTFAPLGPAIVRSNAISDPNKLSVKCWVNDDLLQDGTTSEMIFKPAKLVSYISQVMTLMPGDIIYTGTPPGVGMAREPQRYLKAGDVVRITIDEVGTLTNPVIAAR